MRNIFDQYSGQENRLSHALACCLAEDVKLLRAFIRWSAGISPPPARVLRIKEQALPGEEELPEELARPRGLPDLWMHDDESWSLVVECKVQAPVRADQIQRHRRTAERRGFEKHTVLVISPERPAARSLSGAGHRTWPEVYEWFTRHKQRSEWASRLTDYMQRVELTMTASGYLTKGGLTRFSGIPFGPENPYNYLEAKRLLRLAMDELQQDRRLGRLGVNRQAPRRPAIKGAHGPEVWDFLPLKRAKHSRQFSAFPHLTLAIQDHRVLAVLIVPYGMQRALWRNLTS